ncbi:hypothetical protein GKA01_20710 [Gluconobacter kanchanaburiensis NBRC 103587]|uniref:Uncharacterized protein n=1 Tax=Gluconobacter kanchanaburiensis NBRC 103587 TaxID=1307948 RepID=A0A511B991_9PROT|nr:hypothetical protein GKA01_20710 [Gluconobacter kanchanaburiensis NBRC 103587]
MEMAPAVLADVIVEAPEHLKATPTAYDPAISGEIFCSLPMYEIPDLGACEKARSLKSCRKCLRSVSPVVVPPGPDRRSLV